ncbi:hypothetical protein K491DRAFT_309375 [Lophiostoma macrostomum CBS 122681]|uniref:Uncharacterized protein n=1 Tax=Lophiostoma macrostomum CBS 122681 TaxID=1314788 RepID=A0A6A6SJ60_9PLEO|nr:hypothetical protein K491DRAFT_309375 [Lophiostoma macrostomum CBS 122681]
MMSLIVARLSPGEKRRRFVLESHVENCINVWNNSITRIPTVEYLRSIPTLDLAYQTLPRLSQIFS